MANDQAIYFDAAQGAFIVPVRVYFHDTDAGGVVYHSTYLDFAERARAEMLRLANVKSSQMIAEGCVFVVKRAEVDYAQPALLDDLLQVKTRILSLKNASLQVQQDIERDGESIAQVTVRLGCLNLENGRPQRIPAWVMDALAQYNETDRED